MSSIPPSHLIFELATYALFVICLKHSFIRKERRNERIAILLGGSLYGLLLEILTIYQLQAYKYGEFLVNINGDIPLTIGISWGMILYSTIAIADTIPLSFPAWVAFVGLLGLGIDGTMDTVAIRIGMWNWYAIDSFDGRYLSPHQEWFGVCWGNYFAWFIVLSSAATFIRLFRIDAAKSFGAVFIKCTGAIVLSSALLALLDQLYSMFVNDHWWPIAFIIITAGILIIRSIIINDGLPRDVNALTGLPSFLIPGFYHIYFSFIMLWAAVQPSIIERPEMRSCYFSQLPIIFTISLIITIATFFVHYMRLSKG